MMGTIGIDPLDLPTPTGQELSKVEQPLSRLTDYEIRCMIRGYTTRMSADAEKIDRDRLISTLGRCLIMARMLSR